MVRRRASAALAGAASAAAAARAARANAGGEGPGEVPADPRAAAFFDVDNTVLQGASMFHLARGLYERDLLTGRDLLRFGRQQAAFRVRGVEDPTAIARARESALSFIAGRPVAELAALTAEIFEEVVASKVWPGTRALAQTHLDAGQRVWLVTATPVEIALVLAGGLGLTGALGTVAESLDGVYTGRLVGEILHGSAKAAAVEALAVQEGLDLSRCAAYSDSANDIPMLSLVGDPCAVNPDAALRAYARARAWRVRDYRTGRKAALVGVPTAAGLGAAGAVAAGVARWRSREEGGGRVPVARPGAGRQR